MRIIRMLSLLFAIVLLHAGVFRPAYSAGEAHVVLISIDGFAAYHLQDSNLLLPNIRELIKEGVWAESSETVFPSVTHPSHTTMITGVSPRVHGVLGNTMKNRKTGETYPVTNRPRSESVKARTIFDAARKMNLSTASFYWPETKDDPSVDYNLPEVFDAAGNADIRAVKPAFLQELRNHGVPIDLYFQYYGAGNLKGAGDVVLAQAAAYVIQQYRPNLIAIHFLVTDVTQHSYGPDHYLSKAALTMADHCVGMLRQAVKEAGIAERTTFIVGADHGFHTVKWDVNLHAIFKESGLLDRVNVHPGGWTTYVELEDTFDRARDMATLEKVFDRVRRLEGVARIVRPEEFHALGFPQYEEDVHVPGQYMILADADTHLIFNASRPSTQRMAKDKPYHGHGYLPGYPRMFPAFVIAGPRIQRGQRIGHISNYDIAPTISYLLDLDMKNLPGRVLKEALVN